MLYKFSFRPYQRKFKRTLQTNHGNWDIREGIIIKLIDENGIIALGEIAPIPWFGSESLESALNFCNQLGTEVSIETINSIPNYLPACEFAFESAWETSKNYPPQSPLVKGGSNTSCSLPLIRGGLGRGNTSSKYLNYSSLLPTGVDALELWQPLLTQGYRTFKLKIGVTSIEDEIKIFNQLIKLLPTDVKLRLDANGGLSFDDTKVWLEECDRTIVEFIEQPLPVAQFDAMLELSNQYTTPIALDESVATIDQLEAHYTRGWRGIFVIKPAIAGSPKRLRQFCQTYQIDAVFSSVFETSIGRQAALNLASELSNPNRAVGFGINHWFKEDEDWLEKLWQNP
ncbi:o-succinylbenzoic acid (OSB) synthetase [Crinalium epipsammum PCC 9333]|uniref:o-succinylbenzoate synthase n=1 Tax=Crinalium epipsammum PCC 9333 TaxID=1173022 RepID=K9W2U1_9CYAN|nr:o-succinylbenzoate synthase [Crinalium epipsammum]AFZ14678.1 o-succinylbenzoic acid (OSB) synthetase [Crinalium epipsammum PCC 9333]